MLVIRLLKLVDSCLGLRYILFTLLLSSVDAGFDQFDMPMDVLWLDIEHTDNKK